MIDTQSIVDKVNTLSQDAIDFYTRLVKTNGKEVKLKKLIHIGQEFVLKIINENSLFPFAVTEPEKISLYIQKYSIENFIGQSNNLSFMQNQKDFSDLNILERVHLVILLEQLEIDTDWFFSLKEKPESIRSEISLAIILASLSKIILKLGNTQLCLDL